MLKVILSYRNVMTINMISIFICSVAMIGTRNCILVCGGTQKCHISGEVGLVLQTYSYCSLNMQARDQLKVYL
jgi:hypothetical protein